MQALCRLNCPDIREIIVRTMSVMTVLPLVPRERKCYFLGSYRCDLERAYTSEIASQELLLTNKKVGISAS